MPVRVAAASARAEMAVRKRMVMSPEVVGDEPGANARLEGTTVSSSESRAAVAFFLDRLTSMAQNRCRERRSRFDAYSCAYPISRSHARLSARWCRPRVRSHGAHVAARIASTCRCRHRAGRGRALVAEGERDALPPGDRGHRRSPCDDGAGGCG